MFVIPPLQGGALKCPRSIRYNRILLGRIQGGVTNIRACTCVCLLGLGIGRMIYNLLKSPRNYKKTQTQSDIEQSGAPSKYCGGCDPPFWVIVAISFFDHFLRAILLICCNFRMQFSKQMLQSTTSCGHVPRGLRNHQA
jgi:hypothetical protein